MTTALDPELERSEPKNDPYLISLVRAGDADAFGLLYRRHLESARRLARVLAHDPADVDDLIAETFAKVLGALRAGGGPDTAFRAYLLTTMRHTRYDRARRDRRVEFTDDLTRYEEPQPAEDPTIAELESSYAARAFARLPERWRAVLWHTEVEGESAAEVAPLLGLTPNGVAALAHRARERLRQMYLQEHIAVTSSPHCHWTGSHLGGYVRAALARRDRAKVEEHLGSCAHCRRLHRELTEENSGLRVVLAPLLLGAAAPGYLAGLGKMALGGWLATPLAAVLSGWTHLCHSFAECVAGLVGLAGVLWYWISALPRRLALRFGAAHTAAAGGLVAAGVAGVLTFTGVLVFTDRPAPPRALPVPAPAVQPTYAGRPPLPSPTRPTAPASAQVTEPQVTEPQLTDPRITGPQLTEPQLTGPQLTGPQLTGPQPQLIPPPLTPSGPASSGIAPGSTAPSAAGPTTGTPLAAPKKAEVELVAGEVGVLPITVRMPALTTRIEAAYEPGESPAPEPSAPKPSAPKTSAPKTSATVSAGSPSTGTKPALTLEVALPPGLRLADAGADAGDGWGCGPTPTGATCHRAELAAGGRSVARIPVRAARSLTGFQPISVTVRLGRHRSTAAFRAPVAPPGLRVGYAATGRLGLAVAGNALLACTPRPDCQLTEDNNSLPMVPLLPEYGEPDAPSGLLARGGPTGPQGQITGLAGAKAASGTALDLPHRARVRWAGLVVAASAKELPPLVALHGPRGGWYPVPLTEAHADAGRPLTQGFADVTGLVAEGGDGPWWLAAAADELPDGLGQYAGWSLTVVYEPAKAPRSEVAVYLGPLALRDRQTVSVRLGGGGRTRLGLVIWDGDDSLTGDFLRIGGRAVGAADNLAAGRNDTAAVIACGSAHPRCGWRTPGLDVLGLRTTAPRHADATLGAGADPIEVGVIAIMTGIEQGSGHPGAAR